MSKFSVQGKTVHKNPQVSQSNGSAGSDGIAVLPPDYGFDFIDKKGRDQELIQVPRVGTIQAKFTVRKSGDLYEQEADQVADQVMGMSDIDVAQRQSENDEGEEFPQAKLRANQITSLAQRREESSERPTVRPILESRINSLKNGGQPLDRDTRSFFESRFGHDFSHVRVHADSDAAESAGEINAKACTIGKDILFGSGEYAPETIKGKKLLAHELTHTVQQGATKDSGSVIQKQDLEMTVSQQRNDTPYGWTSAYGLEINASEVGITIHARIVPNAGVSASDVTRVQVGTRREFQRYFDRRFSFIDDSGNSREVVADIEFVDSGEELTINLHAGAGRDDLSNWYVDSDPLDRAHELGHQIGFLDEYVDPAAANRATATSPGVNTDNSIMGNYYTEGRRDADVRARHGDQLATDISSATGTNFRSEWSDTYTVRQGDNLSWIARRIYGDASRWRDIFNLNRDQISDPDLIFPRQVLKLPAR